MRSSDQLSVVSDDPDCKEAPLTALDTWITPTDRFYVRSHFSELPRGEASTWRLSVDGEVERPLDLGLDELRSLGTSVGAVTLECAGNSRSLMSPPAEGLRFQHGAVGNAEWRGVHLRDILSRAGLRDSVTEVLFLGAESGEEEEEGKTLELGYGRSLPLEKALDPGTVVAYEMNGEPLEPNHGFPLRLIVPGWYAMASVKWLKGIQALAEPFQGFFQKRRYVYIGEGETGQALEPVSAIRVKSIVTSPRHGEVIPAGTCTVRGFAWSGQGEIAGVEVSTSGGRSWERAELEGASTPGAWRRWSFQWRASRPGHFILMPRAADSAGNTQPTNVPWNFRGYANHSIHTIAVEVPAA